MKERPILLSGPMVRATLDGRKTQTRRIAKLNESLLHDETPLVQQAASEAAVKVCPYGVPGDRLWVREAWKTYKTLDEVPPREILAGAGVQYRAGGTNVAGISDRLHGMGRWRPGIHMPRWASRITLKVTDVRVQRLQDISDSEARAEGIAELPLQEGEPGAWWTGDALAGRDLHRRTPREAFFALWAKINGALSVASNPWVWVIEFKRLICPCAIPDCPSKIVQPEDR